MKEPRVTQEQLDLMRHTTGMVGEKKPYRNYFIADDGHSDWEVLNELVEMGLMAINHKPVNALVNRRKHRTKSNDRT